jgi:pilus assembly protein FimV
MQMAAFDPTALPDDTLGSTTRMAAFDPSEPPAPLDPQDTIPGIPGADLTGDDGNMLDFELDAPATPTLDLSDPGAVDDGGITFDLTDLGGDSPAGSGGAPDLDLSGISLDLGGGAGVPAVPEGRSENWYDVQTKLDLAKAYQEMGDKEGTREVLQEVLTEGDAEQRSAAQAILDALG